MHCATGTSPTTPATASCLPDDRPPEPFLLRQIRYKAFRQHWNIGVIHADAPTVAGLNGPEAQDRALRATVWMPELPGRFFADPFPRIRPDGSAEILCEDLAWNVGRGEIALVPYRDGQFGRPAPLLRTPFHLSYPFIHEHAEPATFVPEHSAAGDLSIYRADAAGPAERLRTILDGPPVIDPTFLLHEGRHWLFCTHPGPGKNRDLYIYHAEGIDGPWQAHAANPVKCDVVGSRPAGQFIAHDGALFRVGQDCSRYYGRGIIVFRLVELGPERFVEERAAEVYPPSGSPYPYGLHTLASAGAICTIDGARPDPRFPLASAIFGRFLTT